MIIEQFLNLLVHILF